MLYRSVFYGSMNNDITGEHAQEKRMYANPDEPLLCLFLDWSDDGYQRGLFLKTLTANMTEAGRLELFDTLARYFTLHGLRKGAFAALTNAPAGATILSN